jgi:probable rRNA maturation factor
MVEVVNRQRHKRIDPKPWQDFAAKALNAIGQGPSEATIAFVSNRAMRSLNLRFRGVDKTTDVLSFPAETGDSDDQTLINLGDIAISIEQAEKQARENGLNLNEEIAQLILHGLLHLCGYDHETDNGEMNRLELRLRKKLKI